MRAIQRRTLGLVFWMLASAMVQSAAAASSSNDLTGSWVLLVDDFPVVAKTNVVRTYHPLEKYAGNPVLVADQPWEGVVYLYGTVLHDEAGPGYRMWYHTLRPNDPCNDGSTELYATSSDGINWTKPVLDLHPWCGSTANNMYFARSTSGGMTSVMHTPWESDPSQRYKFMNLDTGGYWAGWSSDGINVTDAPGNPVFTAAGDVGQFCWDPHTSQYFGYVKINTYVNGLRRRSVALTTSTNLTEWSSPPSFVLEPDSIDDRWVPAGTVQRTHHYGMSAFPYESGYIGFLWIFRATDVDGYYVGPCFVELVSSHDGVHWIREEGNRPPLLALGANGSWDDSMVFTARAPVRDGDTLKVWYGGFDQVHGFSLSQTVGSIGLATMRKDGFASLDAGATTGTVLTKNLIGASGQLHVNYQTTNSGSLKVEVLDENNNVLAGYGQADCVALTGDSANQVVTWTAHSSFPVSPSRLRLRFVLQNASVYSFMAGDSTVVAAPPAITQQPGKQTIRPGRTGSFTVGADGSGPLFYQWQKDSLNLGDGGHYAGSKSSTLVVSSAESIDGGSYRCVVTNLYGSVTSSPAILTVNTNLIGFATLTNIPLGAGYVANEARAVAPDGKYVVGFHGTFSTSGSAGYLYYVINHTIHEGILTPDGSSAGGLTGVGYRTYLGHSQLVLDGWSSGWHANFMTTNGGTSWDLKRRDTNLGSSPGGPAANSMAGTATDAFFAAFRHHASNPGNPVYVGKAWGAWPPATNAPATLVWDLKGIPSGITASMNGVSATGRAVGYRTVNGARNNYVLDWNGSGAPGNWFFHGLNAATNAGEAFSISANGTSVFGQSPVSDGRTGSWGYKTLLTTNVPGTVLSIYELPNFPDTSSASGSAAVPYGCTGDGRYAVGMSYRGTEKAVLWDTGDPNPARWTVLDLTELAAANGILDIFYRLTRAYSVGTNASGELVIAGVGSDSVNARAFVMTLAPPIAPFAHPPMLKTVGSAATGMSFSFMTISNVNITYYLERATNLIPPVSWTPVNSAAGDGTELTLTDPTPPPTVRFYRLRVQ